jgi:prepilin-type N-terminal cleavage/methylation domain-containing protein
MTRSSNHHATPLDANTAKTARNRRFAVAGASSRHGLNLLEMLVVVVIAGIVAAIVLPRLATRALDARKNSCYVNKGKIEVQTQLWYRNKGSWPATNLSDIAADTAYFPEGLPTCPVDSTAYTIDAATHKVVGHTH